MSYTNAQHDPESARALVKTLGETPKMVTPKEIVSALDVLVPFLLRNNREICIRGINGAPDWLGYEHELWQISESLRGYLSTNKAIRGRHSFIDYLAGLIRNKKLGKGRQNFLLVLAQYGKDAYAREIAGLLNDPDVSGHAVLALSKLKTPGFAVEVQGIMDSTKFAWVRNAAKRYLKSVEPPS